MHHLGGCSLSVHHFLLSLPRLPIPPVPSHPPSSPRPSKPPYRSSPLFSPLTPGNQPRKQKPHKQTQVDELYVVALRCCVKPLFLLSLTPGGMRLRGGLLLIGGVENLTPREERPWDGMAQRPRAGREAEGGAWGLVSKKWLECCPEKCLECCRRREIEVVEKLLSLVGKCWPRVPFLQFPPLLVDQCCNENILRGRSRSNIPFNIFIDPFLLFPCLSNYTDPPFAPIIPGFGPANLNCVHVVPKYILYYSLVTVFLFFCLPPS